MNETTNLLAWVARAEEDCTIARSSLRRKKPLTYGACFHAQQCAEKYLKAALVAMGLGFPKTHDLLTLNTLCEQAGMLFDVAPAQLADLSSYAVQVRYPGENPTPDEAAEALEVAQLVRRVVRRWLRLKPKKAS